MARLSFGDFPISFRRYVDHTTSRREAERLLSSWTKRANSNFDRLSVLFLRGTLLGKGDGGHGPMAENPLLRPNYLHA